MENSRNVIAAIGLSFVVLLGWQYFIVGPQMEEERQRLAAEQQLAEQTSTAPAAGETASSTTPATTAPTAPVAPGTPADAASQTAPTPATGSSQSVVNASREAALLNSDRVTIETPSLQGSINLTGGRFDDLLLTQYRETIDPDSPLIHLFSPLGSLDAYYAEFGWVTTPDGPAVPDGDTVWTASSKTLVPGQDVTLTWDNGEGMTFRRVISVDDDYMFNVSQSVDNSTDKAVTLYPYGLVIRYGIPDITNFFILHEGMIGFFGEDGLSQPDYSDLEDNASITPPKTINGWLGITDKYWAATLIPVAEKEFQGRFVGGQAGTQPTFQADYLGAPVTVAAGGEGVHEAHLFAGAKLVNQIDAYEENLGIDRFDLMIDWGWLYFLTKPLFFVIDWFFGILGNFGLAILATTVVIKAIFLPLANKSYASMSRMKKVQPEMKKLQERFKDDRMGLQKAMMELYKKEKINPLSGCWPIMIQIPVFFALYKVLFVTIEMRHAPFFGWIQDLSAPDPTSLFNLFGILPFTPPSFLMIGIWPIIMGITMFVQMKMNPQPPDKTQAMIFNWMPLLFTFMLATFPAGLVIYWAWNNTLSVLQQGFIMRRHGVKIELFDNLKGLIGKRGKDNDDNKPAE